MQVSCTCVMVFIKIFLANALRSHLKPWCELCQTSSLWKSFFQDCAWCLCLCAEQFRNEVQLQQAFLRRFAAATSPLGHGRFPQDGMAQFNLSLIWDFKWWLLYWRKSLPAHCLATHLSRSDSLMEHLCNFPWMKTLPISPHWEQSTVSLQLFCKTKLQKPESKGSFRPHNLPETPLRQQNIEMGGSWT